MKFNLDIPSTVNRSEFLDLSFKMWRSMFNLPILYSKNDKSDYVWAQGYKNERVEIFPGKLASGEKATIDANIRYVYSLFLINFLINFYGNYNFILFLFGIFIPCYTKYCSTYWRRCW